ncbi:MAG: sodium:proton antiporter [Oligoflexus sp.]|nr:sodium:proton antiporter [Oligoflexus sp.]
MLKLDSPLSFQRAATWLIARRHVSFLPERRLNFCTGQDSMDISTIWFLVVGAVFIAMAGFSSWVTKLPLTTGIVYALIGVGIGPFGIDILVIDLFRHTEFLEHVTEIAVVISLFTAGLKLNLPLTDPQWRLAVLLATATMLINVVLVALAAHFILDFSPGAALLLGAILSPTDPVLASDVQMDAADQRDRLRFALTAEGGLNDATAFPFVVLGLGLLGKHELGSYAGRWLGMDLIWSFLGGVAIGYAMGIGVSRFIVYLRQQERDSEKLDDFLTLGLIALSYGVALSLQASGFIAVFAAGIALRSLSRPSVRMELEEKGKEAVTEKTKEMATLPETVLSFNEQLERVAEVVVVIILGAMISRDVFSNASWIFAIGLMFLVRPLSVGLVIARNKTVSTFQKRYIAWLGIRGIGSLYYLAYAVNHGIEEVVAKTIADITFGVIILSIVVHGFSVTPLMAIYEKRLKAYRTRLTQRFERRRGLRPPAARHTKPEQD